MERARRGDQAGARPCPTRVRAVPFKSSTSPRASSLEWKRSSHPSPSISPQAYKDRAEATNAEAAREYAEKVEAGEIDEAAEEDGDAAPDTSLPLARVKRIMKLDKEVKHAAVDACKCVTRATELFLESLVEGAFASMKAQKRKTIKYQDVEHHVLRKQRLEFLHDHVWAMQEKATATDGGKENRGTETEGRDDGEGTETEGGARAPPEAPPGARQVTDFFSPAQEQAAEETPA